MLRLTQKAWNNVVIFAMLFMVYLFTISNDMLNDGESSKPETAPLFPPFSVVMSMDFGVAKIDRIGQDWRVAGLKNPAEATAVLPELIHIMETWSELEAIPFVAKPQSAPYIVTILLAGEDKKRVYQVYEFEGDVFFKLNADGFFVEGVRIKDIFPVRLLD